jgi:hypothetical protein
LLLCFCRCLLLLVPLLVNRFRGPLIILSCSCPSCVFAPLVLLVCSSSSRDHTFHTSLTLISCSCRCSACSPRACNPLLALISCSSRGCTYLVILSGFRSSGVPLVLLSCSCFCFSRARNPLTLI